jgi:hypothetical protein
MSKEAVEAIIGKALLDTELRKALFANPDEVLAAYDLSEEEVAALKAIDAEAMESFAGTLDEAFSELIIAAHPAKREKSPQDRGFEFLSGSRPDKLPR